MKRSLLAVWILCPIGLLAWHFGPGEKHLARDRAGDYLRRAAAAESAEQWEPAARLYRSAREALPENDPGRNPLELAEARTRINAGEMIEGQEQIQNLLAKLEGKAEKGTVRKRGQAPFVRSTRRAVPAKGACHLFPPPHRPGHRRVGPIELLCGLDHAARRGRGGRVEAGGRAGPPTVPPAGRTGQGRQVAGRRAVQAKPGGHDPPGADGPQHALGQTAAEKMLQLQKLEPASASSARPSARPPARKKTSKTSARSSSNSRPERASINVKEPAHDFSEHLSPTCATAWNKQCRPADLCRILFVPSSGTLRRGCIVADRSGGSVSCCTSSADNASADRPPRASRLATAGRCR